MDPVVTLQSIVTELPASSEGARYLSNLIDRMAQGRMSITTALGMLRYAHDDSSRFPVEDGWPTKNCGASLRCDQSCPDDVTNPPRLTLASLPSRSCP